jgi:hypothetical protein
MLELCHFLFFHPFNFFIGIRSNLLDGPRAAALRWFERIPFLLRIFQVFFTHSSIEPSRFF